MTTTEPAPDLLSMLLVMGVTGSGKSYLINKLARSSVVEEGARLNSCTSACQAVLAEISGKKVLLIDTPGFDDTKRTDAEVLGEITRMLVAQYKIGVTLKGVIYLHRISDVRYAGSAVKTLRIFEKICGNDALKNVIFATTRWNKAEEATNVERETQLRTEFWPFMIAQGSIMTRYYGDEESALVMAGLLLEKSGIILDIQRELVQEGKKLHETGAGAIVNDNLAVLKEQLEGETRELEELNRALREQDRAMKRQVQKDWESHQEKLKRAAVDQDILQADVNEEVEHEIKERKSRRKEWICRGAGLAVRLLPTMLDLIGVFVGFPPGCASLLAAWLSASGATGGVADFFKDL